ncbi:cation:proton antiporter [Oscillatoria sp. CS-180]|uniref:cation:proton antiporter n=1 Tax=Oscillatoria sp. CS-180 TaxID=3021720 RepID=UPI002330A7DC|nr:cation:proton antiporter [Oscillatoria sp. CS-180]MDB9528821.1 cation:proton antiporter [Oscillatoria sp. CS-180]
MNTLTILWIALPLFVGFSGYLLPHLTRTLALSITSISIAYGLSRIVDPNTLTLELLDNFGVTLVVDSLSGFFILTNALVTTAVVLYCWQQGKSKFFYTQTIILHGSVNAVFICADLMSLYVALEVIGIAAFLLIAYPRTDRSIWVGLRYLFISNTAMLFYLMGAVLVYQTNQSFSFNGLENAPTDAIALIVLGLLTKGGIFASGLWLPLTHSESETPVSALLSGVVVKTGVFPLVRFALIAEDIAPILQVFSIGTALLGVSYAILEKDTKRMLASSTISQIGFVLAAPAAAGFYALTHGLAKASLFLIAGNLPSRDFQTLKRSPLPRGIWLAIVIASLSISGLPLLAGFEAKALTTQNLEYWHATVMNLIAVGTAIAFAKFIFLPVEKQTASAASYKKIKSGFWLAIGLLLSGLVLANGQSFELYTVNKVLIALAIVGTGWTTYWLIFRRFTLKLPQGVERFENLIGIMSLMLMLLFGMVVV